MANNGGVVKTWTANNASSVTGTYADWYSTGDTEWIIEVTGTTSTGTTVTWNGAVRVAKSYLIRRDSVSRILAIARELHISLDAIALSISQAILLLSSLCGKDNVKGRSGDQEKMF